MRWTTWICTAAAVGACDKLGPAAPPGLVNAPAAVAAEAGEGDPLHPTPLVPIITLDGSVPSGYAPLGEGFDGTRSYTSDLTSWIASCRWSFGDGTPDGSTCWVPHVYEQPGTYQATLTITDNFGRHAESTLPITVSPNPGPVAVPVFETPGNGPAPLDVSMDGSRSYVTRPNGWVAACRWDFGDGSEPVASCWAHHVYRDPGRYVARFTVTDELGISSTKTLDVNALGNEHSMLGSWTIVVGSRDCPLRFWTDDGSSVAGNCDNGTFDHELRGQYAAPDRIAGINTRYDPWGCATTVNFTITFIDQNTVEYWQEGWNGCGVRTEAGSGVWDRVSWSW